MTDALTVEHKQRNPTTMQPCALPPASFLRKYLDEVAYVDCYVTEIARPVAQSDYVEAFYTTGVFKLERLLLSWFVSKPSTDAEARQLALGTRTGFSAWTVERQTADQLLLSDFTKRTKSWLMVDAVADGDNTTVTRLYFGSAVVPAIDKKSGRSTLGFTFRALLGFHKLYSKVLLSAARSRLTRS
jgi:hypothetical protein